MEALNEAMVFWQRHQTAPLETVESLLDFLTDEAHAVESRAQALEQISLYSENAPQLAVWIEALQKRCEPCGLEGGYWRGKALFDCAGTGGGGMSILNISTAAVFVLAALGVPVVKHGNRGVTRKSGSADVIEALGISLEISPAQTSHCLEEAGAVFLYAPCYHPVLKKLAPVRQFLGSQAKASIFNLVGPLLNPAVPAAQMIGVLKPGYLDLYAEILRLLKRPRYLVVWGQDDISALSLSEVSVSGKNEFRAQMPGSEDPATWPIERLSGNPLEALRVNNALESAQRIESILGGQDNEPGREFVVANAAAGLCVHRVGLAYVAARDMAREALDSGKAAGVLTRWRKFSQRGKN
jgi:anthranilate phosphoribosyltransferase